MAGEGKALLRRRGENEGLSPELRNCLSLPNTTLPSTLPLLRER